MKDLNNIEKGLLKDFYEEEDYEHNRLYRYSKDNSFYYYQSRTDCLLKFKIFSTVAVISLVLIIFNILIINSISLGLPFGLIYLSIISFFTGNIFFDNESLQLKTFYGFITFFCVLVVLGGISYLFYKVNDMPIIVVLTLYTGIITILNIRRDKILNINKIAINIVSFKLKLKSLNLNVLDLIFIALISLSYFFLFQARTGESVPPLWNLVSDWFFVSLFSAGAILIIKIWQNKSPSGLLLLYIFFIVLIPATGYLIIMQHPYATMKSALSIEYDRQITLYGRFVSDPSLPEAAKSVLNKNILEMGQHFGNVFLIKLLQVSSKHFSLYFIPFVSSALFVIVPFKLIHSILPGNKKMALFCSLSILATQFNIFLFTPPGKNETFALALTMFSIFLWVKFLRKSNPNPVLFLLNIVILISTLLIHQYVGIFSLFIAASAMGWFILKLKKDRLHFLRIWYGINILLIFIFVLGYGALHSVASEVVGYTTGEISFSNITFGDFIKSIFPLQGIEYNGNSIQWVYLIIISNATYIYYFLIILGIAASLRYHLNKIWCNLNVFLILLAFLYFSIAGNFNSTPDSFRYFYYFSFFASPFIGIAIYYLLGFLIELRMRISISFGEKDRLIGYHFIQKTFGIALISAIFLSSIYAGYPWQGSTGPYVQNNDTLVYPSDYDRRAIDYISSIESNHRDIFITGDTFTCVEGVYNLGYQVIDTSDGYIPIFSFFRSAWGTDQMFNLAVNNPMSFVFNDVVYTNKIADKNYIIFTYRLGKDKLNSLVSLYSKVFGQPVYSITEKIVVFSYDAESIKYLLANERGNTLLFVNFEPLYAK